MNRCERVDAFTASLGTAESLDWMLRAGEAGLTGFAVFDDPEGIPRPSPRRRR
jgi:hypothetical protein